MASDDVTGRWTGHYFQHDRPSPITAELTQDGDRLTGRMRDGHTESARSVFEAAADFGLPPGEDERIVARLREQFPEAPPGPIRYVTRLPPDSLLEGWVHDGTVYFLKRYQGVHCTGFQVGEQIVGVRSDDHAVHYRGQLSADGRRIEGQWWIDARPELHTTRAEGRFTLRRDDGTGVVGWEATAAANRGSRPGR